MSLLLCVVVSLVVVVLTLIGSSLALTIALPPYLLTALIHWASLIPACFSIFLRRET